MTPETAATPRVALVATLLNEAATVDALLASVAAQTRPPDEIRLVDGGSTDDTVARARAWAARGLPLVVDKRPGANIAAGRNAAIAATTAPLVAVTDAGVTLAPDWLAAPASPLRRPGRRRGRRLLSRRPAHGLRVCPRRDDPAPGEEIDPAAFLPSSRSVAFRRAAWARVGGYPEWLDFCEDLVFDLALRAAGCRFAWEPRAIAHFRPRPTLAAFFRQYYLYARGDGKADLWRHRHAIRYGTYLVLLPLLGAFLRRQPRLALPALLGPALYVRRPYQRLWQQTAAAPLRTRLAALPLPPILRFTGDVAKMLGYPVGVAWRWRHGDHRGRPGPRVRRASTTKAAGS